MEVSVCYESWHGETTAKKVGHAVLKGKVFHGRAASSNISLKEEIHTYTPFILETTYALVS